jgi:P2-related tail formation protein
MADVFNIRPPSGESGEALSFDGHGGGGDDGGMEHRLTALETRLDAILPTLATKADLHEAINGQIKWMVGTAVALGASAITVMSFVLNNAVPKQASAPQTAPIVIQVPYPQAPAAAPQAPAAKH